MSAGEGRRNHRTRWTVEEIEFLESEWDGTHATAAIIAELLDRTVNAVLQRHYETEWGTAPEPVEVKPEVNDTPRPSSRTTTRTVYRVVQVEVEITEDNVCPSCHLLLPASGVCGYC